MPTPFTHKPTLENCKIYRMLRRQSRAKHSSFHTPGHKQRGLDITELSYSDNLASPNGCIAEAEKDLASLLHASASFILTDGSTSGVYAMLSVASAFGVKTLAVDANAHKSVFCGCALFRITPVLFHVEQLDNEGLQKADGVLVTSPNYYGKIPALAELKAFCEKRNKLFLIDGAHGAHLHFDETLHASGYADLWVDGVHKSLPALTQGAVVSAKSERLVPFLKKAVDTFRTTSPSYPIMASVEYAVKYPRNLDLESAVKAFAKSTERVEIHEDWTKFCVKFGKNANAVFAKLEKRGIYAEFCDGENVLFYLSPAVRARAFRRLCKIVKVLLQKYPYIPVERIPAPVILQKSGETEWLDLPLSTGRICAEDCGLFPPCTPLLRKGEVISKEKIRLLENAVQVFGLWENKILVFKREIDE